MSAGDLIAPPPDGDVPGDARRVSVGFGRLPHWLDGVAERHGPLHVTTAGDRLLASAHDGTRVWIDVPFPPLPASEDALAGLIRHVQRSRRVGVLLVRRGGFGVAVFDGPELIASKVGSSYVQGTTKAGGWSQQRFARRRANQARSAFERAADETARVVLPETGTLDALICGGDRAAVEAVLADPRLGPLRAKRADPWLAVPDPRRAVLETSPTKFLAVAIRIHP